MIIRYIRGVFWRDRSLILRRFSRERKLFLKGRGSLYCWIVLNKMKVGRCLLGIVEVWSRVVWVVVFFYFFAFSFFFEKGCY